MKLRSKESLMVGGIYSVLSTPFFMYKTSITEQINIFLFSIFIICMFLLYWSRFYLFISSLGRKFSRISYYLMSIGWIPYFLIVGIPIIFICAGVFSWNDNILYKTIGIFNLICSWGLPVSLIIAYIRVMIKTKSLKSKK